MTNRISSITAKVIHQLWNNGKPNKGELAALRNSRHITDRNMTIVWPILFNAMKEKDLSKNGLPTYSEKAIFAALHCFAIYQQGNDGTLIYESAGRDKEGKALFFALQLLRQDQVRQKAIDRRVQTILGNSSFESIENSIYHLVQILKSNFPKEKIDFAQLASDFYAFQFSAETARQVCLMWGQQYYWIPKNNDNQKGE